MDFLEYLKKKGTVLFDGGMGTQLARYGLELSGGVNNLTNPEIVLRVHQDYIQSGAQVLISNTFTMNPIYMRTHNIDLDCGQVNRAGVEIAKKAAGEECFVFGDLGPTGQLLAPYGEYREEEIYENYKIQAELLADSGVDGFIIETMMDLGEAICALRACKDTAKLPAIVSMTLASKNDGGKTMMGQTLRECAAAVAQAGGDAIGTNCGELDPLEIAELVALLSKETNLPILVEPNAGKPKLVQGKTVYDMAPEEFAGGVLKCREAGAALLGGCCGTTPEHIQAVKQLLDMPG